MELINTGFKGRYIEEKLYTADSCYDLNKNLRSSSFFFAGTLIPPFVSRGYIWMADVNVDVVREDGLLPGIFQLSDKTDSFNLYSASLFYLLCNADELHKIPDPNNFDEGFYNFVEIRYNALLKTPHLTLAERDQAPDSLEDAVELSHAHQFV